MHQQGFRLTLHPDRRLDVATADGVPLPHHRTLPLGDRAALDRAVTADTLPSTHCDARIDLGYVVSVLLQQAA